MGSKVSLEFTNSFNRASLVLTFRFCFYFADAMTFAFARRIYCHLLLRTWFSSIFFTVEEVKRRKTTPWLVGIGLTQGVKRLRIASAGITSFRAVVIGWRKIVDGKFQTKNTKSLEICSQNWKAESPADKLDLHSCKRSYVNFLFNIQKTTRFESIMSWHRKKQCWQMHFHHHRGVGKWGKTIFRQTKKCFLIHFVNFSATETRKERTPHMLCRLWDVCNIKGAH